MRHDTSSRPSPDMQERFDEVSQYLFVQTPVYNSVFNLVDVKPHLHVWWGLSHRVWRLTWCWARRTGRAARARRSRTAAGGSR